MVEQATKQVTGSTPVRSPKYPYITFQDALEKAKNVYKAERRAPTTPAILYTHLGYQKKTGSSGRVASALKQYGLLDEVQGQYKISDQAFRLFNLPDDDPERLTIMGQMAMRPKIFQDVLNQYPDGLPSDATLKSYLILEKDFNENGADIFIRVLKAAQQVAKTDNGLAVEEGAEDVDVDDDADADELSNQITNKQFQNTPPKAKKTTVTQPPAEGQSQFSISLTPEGEMKVLFSGEVTQDAFSVLQGILEMQKARPQKPASESSVINSDYQQKDREYPCEAIWNNKDFDQPVTIIGKAGPKDGKMYYNIADSETGIPEDELEFQETNE